MNRVINLSATNMTDAIPEPKAKIRKAPCKSVRLRLLGPSDRLMSSHFLLNGGQCIFFQYSPRPVSINCRILQK
jgi:hypothetical protein